MRESWIHIGGLNDETDPFGIENFNCALSRRFAALFGGCFDFAVSVPSFGERPRMELFVRDFAARRGLCYCPELLIKTRPTEKQHRLSAAERRTNLRGAFAASEAVCGKSILLVDDIFTTGSTVSECAAALHAVGAKSVSVLTVLRTEDKTEKSDNRKEK